MTHCSKWQRYTTQQGKIPGSCEVYIMVKKKKKTNTGQVNLKGKDADVVVHQ